MENPKVQKLDSVGSETPAVAITERQKKIRRSSQMTMVIEDLDGHQEQAVKEVSVYERLSLKSNSD